MLNPNPQQLRSFLIYTDLLETFPVLNGILIPSIYNKTYNHLYRYGLSSHSCSDVLLSVLDHSSDYKELWHLGQTNDLVSFHSTGKPDVRLNFQARYFSLLLLRCLYYIRTLRNVKPLYSAMLTPDNLDINGLIDFEDWVACEESDLNENTIWHDVEHNLVRFGINFWLFMPGVQKILESINDISSKSEIDQHFRNILRVAQPYINKIGRAHV